MQQKNYGTNDNHTQSQLVQDIVALAFGGPSNDSAAFSNITGILNPGIFQNQEVNLLPLFNGSIASSNLNVPTTINWLDGGGLEPLQSYLEGDTPYLSFAANSYQSRLFSHFLVDFSHSFGCSQPPPSSDSLSGTGRLNLAYVHKFMNLTFTDLGYFIHQLSKTTTHFGFSDSDSATLITKYNSLYTVRCAPPTSNGDASQGPQLLSLCQDSTSCPLAEPISNCSAYVNLAPSPVAPAETTAVSSTNSSTPTSTGLTVSSTTPTPKAKLSEGAIAGISIGGAAGALLAIGAILFWYRRRQIKADFAPPQSNGLTDQGPYTFQASTDRKSGQSMQHRQSIIPELDSLTSARATTEQPMSELDSPTSPQIGPMYNHRNVAEMPGS